MADQETRAAVDRLSRTTADVRARLRPDGSAARPAEAQLGLKFSPKDRVIDLVTGQRATVNTGRVSESTGRGVFVVTLRTGEMTHRDERELEADHTPAPAPGR